ncbi:alpha/beta fold hydrolase [Xenorhabdus innexi]|uniref:Carboxylesterase n=1 Tax=Xenorhabdus innexi TaxID=290109 RepID=A0A1N6MW83_9GAMM|nr:alpha/beta hydrolase [Xenorhabdus innexi]PHM30984.1 carboxylesterase [Xenorhabdus innexi]SIP73106.1 putative Carboxylesterase [Xenorhabdus innexi]
MQSIERSIHLADSFVSYCKYFSANQETSKNPVMFLHGTNSGGASFGKIINTFNHERSVIIPDYAGCGNSTLPSGELTVEYLAEQVAAVINDSSDKPVDLVGFSLGAVVAAVVAATHPQLVNRLVLTAPWATNDDPYFRLVLSTWLKLENSDQALATAFGLSHVLSPEFISSVGQDTLDQICARPSEKETNRRIALGLSINIKNYLTWINKETLIIGLSHDTLIPPYLAREVHECVKNSQYAEVKSGHAVPMENPVAWTSIINDFLQKNKP